MILVNNLVVIRFLPWSDRLGYFCIFVEEYSRETQIQTQQIATKSAFACFFHVILLLTTKKISYICSVNSKLEPWRRTREFTLFIIEYSFPIPGRIHQIMTKLNHSYVRKVLPFTTILFLKMILFTQMAQTNSCLMQ